VRAVVLEKAGPDPIVVDTELSDPTPGLGELMVRVKMCGYCHHDAAIMAGILRRGTTLPLVLGHEIAGLVEQVGNNVDSHWIGKEVVLLPGSLGHRVNGGLAEFVCVAEASAVPVPAFLLPGVSCLLACPLGVAVNAVENIGQVSKGEKVVVTGVSGGVGSNAAQIAYGRGCQVIGITTDETKVKSLEATSWLKAVIVHGELSFDEGVFALTDGEGVDVVIDTVGGRLLAPGVSSLARNGRMVLVGQSDPGQGYIPTAEIIFRQARLLGSLGVDRRHIERALALIDSDIVRPSIDRFLPLSARAVLDTFRRMINRQGQGRTVLTVSNDE
jgi:NADPH:quinone reductase-like Zn-dependent oxidoreductase